MKNIFLILTLFIYCFSLFSQEITTTQLEYIKDNPDILEQLNEDMASDSSPEIEGQDKSLDDVENINEQFKTQHESDVFGFDYITKIPQSITSTSDLPVPNDYVLSLGDELKIILTGGKKDIFSVIVGLDGTILFPEIGVINVFGESLQDVKNKIKGLVEVSYVGTDVSIGIEKLAARKINIVGAVENPGTYIVNPFSTITSSLSYSGGFKEYASLRNIQLIRDGDKLDFDLYDLLIYGNRTSDQNIQPGDTLRVQANSNFVSLEGEILRPQIYEYKRDDTYQDIVNFGLGLTNDADKNNLYVVQVSNGSRNTIKINLEDKIGDKIIEKLYVGSKVYASNNNIFVDGAGVSKGYVSSEIKNFAELLNALDFSTSIYPYYAVYDFQTSKGFSQTRKAFSLADPQTYKDFEVHNNSTIYFFDRDFILQMSEFLSTDSNDEEFSTNEDENNLLDTVIDSDVIQFKAPNNDISIPVKGKITPKLLHEYFGVVDNVSIKNVAVITESESFSDSYSEIYNSEDIVAITLPKIQSDLITVTISGQILNPGTYKLSASTSLDELYTLAGGILDNSFNEGIFFSRQSVKENQEQAIVEARTVLVDSLLQKSATNERAIGDINAIIELADNLEPTGRITGDFHPGTEFAKTFLLSDGDNIFIPALRNEVTVEGEVLNSTSFLYDESLSFDSYIDAAGGYSSYADKQAVFVIRANGIAIKIDRNIFSGNSIDIKAGDTIVVPRDLNQIDGLPLIQVATNIISNIAFSAASLNALKN
tara:strand:- start:1046 stop:3340 length:2295 start_codon:yes stop_codon:yes gene_type:complete